MKPSPIKNLLFDFGGVIIDLHIDRTIAKFAQLSGRSLAEMVPEYGKSAFFNRYEMGLISDDEFRNSLADYLGISRNTELVDEAWNAMLGEIPRRRIERLSQLSEQYDVYLLSNTNEIHYQVFNPMIPAVSDFDSLDDLFIKAYYSHRINMRKPTEEIFVHVLEDSDLRAEETLFLDDTRENLNTASKLNFQTFHVEHPDSWLEKF